MIIWHIMGFWFVAYLYFNGLRIIKARYQDAGMMNNGFFRRNTPLYRDGELAVNYGRAMQYQSFFLFFVLVFDILGIHDASSVLFLLSILFWGFVVEMLIYPPKDKKLEKPKIGSDHN